MSLLTSVIALACLAPASPPQGNFEKTWQSIESIIRARYFARESRKEEMDRNLKVFGEKAKAAKTRYEFSNHVNAMIAAFKDSHFDFLTNEDQGFYSMRALLNQQSQPKMPHIDAWFVPVASGYQIRMVMNSGAAERAGLRKGDVITKIDGKPFSPIASMAPYVGKEATIEYQRQAVTMQAKVQVEEDPALTMFLNGSTRSTRIIDRKDKKIGYFRLWTMTTDAFRNALSAAVYGALRDTDAIILDLRDGFGGRPEGFADPFFRPEVNIEWKFGERTSSKQLFGYQRPLAVLINEGSRSAKEVISFIFKASKRATLIGTNTAGHVLGTSPVPVEDWAVLEVPMVEVIANGIRLEGVGVSPDIKVEPEFDSEGNDRIVQAALAHLAP